MRITGLVVFATLGLALLLAACGDDKEKASEKGTKSAGQTHFVEMGDMDPGKDTNEYHPETVEISPGDTIIWRNKSKMMTHTATRDSDPIFNEMVAAGGDNKSNAVKIDNVKSGDVLEYYCKKHDTMKGHISVR